ncbi:hypothetical protein [Kocuria sp.]|uniref:hypothetical protein n=1 Tax=Kocuria sp. TaxID=1871328 RepID=UPI0026DEC755|nr:hypothetical protein [Kocuria sp.]MDO5618833.1 hypothetical protein [Kocuria sp.]
MTPLLNAGSAWRGAAGLPQRFTLRAYVALEDLEPAYRDRVSSAVSPQVGQDGQLSETLARLCTQERGALPPAREPLWTMNFSAAPAAAHGLLTQRADFPVYHPPQQLHRALQTVTSEEQQHNQPLITLLLNQEEVRKQARHIRAERRTRNFARDSNWTVPMSWFSLFADEDRAPLDQDGHVTHRMIVPADTAARRAAWGAQVLNATQDEELLELGADLHRMARWAAQFSSSAVICLDYGSIAAPLQPDESPRDFQDALHLLDDGDDLSAEVALRRIMKRWMPLAHLEYAG